MKILFRKWRGLPVALAIAASTLAAHAVVQVKTLGGGPHQTSPSRSGAAYGDTFRHAKFNNPSSIPKRNQSEGFDLELIICAP